MNGSAKYIIRHLQGSENHLLREFLYEAIYIPEGVKPPSKDVVDLPELKLYIEDFGKKKDDFCLVADCEGKVVGAVWVRIMNGNHSIFRLDTHRNPAYLCAITNY